MTRSEQIPDEYFAADDPEGWQQVVDNLSTQKPPGTGPANGSERPLIVIASNRGPFSFGEEESGEIMFKKGSGGLVTALGALAEQHEVLWVAAALSEADRKWAERNQESVQEVEGIHLRLVTPPEHSYDQYY